MRPFDVTDALALAARHDLHLSAHGVTVNEAGLDYRDALAADVDADGRVHDGLAVRRASQSNCC
ncbi:MULTISPECIES: hypothetical protein [Rhodococcus]|uniref:hypothetical protein n=1 Tax=Rhodococcus TaxID=1827 RepID=UPI001C562F7F|nr:MULTISPECIES: hypothetical protein [unclassified Rhodococcus (in: high G+C Gram-positive bacteria)]QXU56315.1 hypothetical protein KXC42_11660 [Rhodococcus sp. LW-XY12]